MKKRSRFARYREKNPTTDSYVVAGIGLAIAAGLGYWLYSQSQLNAASGNAGSGGGYAGGGSGGSGGISSGEQTGTFTDTSSGDMSAASITGTSSSDVLSPSDLNQLSQPGELGF
jgi:hypothetical protein